MMITRNRIRSLAGSSSVFEEGSRIFQKGQVEICSTDRFWKDEIRVRAVAHGDRETEKQVNLLIRSGKIASSRCSCIRTDARKGQLCAHGVALALLLMEMYEMEDTDSGEIVRPLIEIYGQQRYQDVVADYTQEIADTEPVSILPVLSVENGKLAMELKIGNIRFYRVRDISALLEACIQGNRVAYGKFLNFYHIPEAFTPESVQLLQTLINIHKTTKDMTEERLRKSGRTVYSRNCSRLLLGKEDLDEVMECLLRIALEESEDHGTEETVLMVEAEEILSPRGICYLKRGNPALQAILNYRNRNRPDLGTTLVLKNTIRIFHGQLHLYLMENETMWIADRTFSRRMAPFLDCLLSHQEDISEGMRISNADMPGFCSNVLPVIEKHMQVDCASVDLQAYRKHLLRTEFFFDLQNDMEITLKILHHYGDISFNPAAGENPSLPWRDLAGEKQVALTVQRYFEKRYPDKGLLTTYDNEEKAIELAADGFAVFQRLGKIHISKSLSELKIRRPKNLHFQVNAFSDWLELTVDLDGLKPKELLEILSGYKEKKNCYRLKNRDYVLMDHQKLDILPELMEGLQLSAGELSGGVSRIMGSRSMYLKRVFEEYQVKYSHNEYFEKLTDSLDHLNREPIPIPDSMKPILRDYQIKGYEWLSILDRLGFGGILADDMGLGKTIQMIALFCSIYGKENSSSDRGQNPSLIICPASLLYNWQNEISRFAPELTSVVITGNGKERKKLLREKPEAKLWITSYDMLRRDIDLYASCEFRIQVLDEAQYIKNQGTQTARAVKKIHSSRRFALTGTPVENRLGELWSIFDYLMPGFLFSYSRFRNIFELPLVKEQDTRVVNRLHNMTSPFILRRLKKDVLTELPDKCDTILYAELTGEQKRLYAANALQLRTSLEHQTEEIFQRNRANILSALTRLREICCAPSLIYEDFTAENAKMEALMELVHSCLDGGHRILVFSQFARMLRLIEKRLEEDGISCFTLTGQTGKQERQQLVERFEEGEVPVFLISLKAGGTGLNLTGADTVIHFDPWWNVAAQNQATDRAHRIGQTREVNVYRLIAKDTIEENILKLQEAKQSLVDQILGGKHVSLTDLTREELMKLL